VVTLVAINSNEAMVAPVGGYSGMRLAGAWSQAVGFFVVAFGREMFPHLI
jgi:hypothetical protein